jgi:hypothetical protein
VDLQALALSLLISVVAVVVWAAAERWWMRQSVRRFAARLRRDWGTEDPNRPRLYPECLCTVELSDASVSCTSPSGYVESVDWDDLRRVEIVTTDEGPFLPNVFWVLHGSERGCVVPQGATGERALLERLQKLPGFRNEAVIEAVPSTVNCRFLCWERPNRP